MDNQLMLIKHVYSGLLPLYELQIYSLSQSKQIALCTSPAYGDIVAYCIAYDYDLPSITVCKHERVK